MQFNERQEVIAARELGEGVNTGRPLLTGRQRAILAGVLADQRYLAGLPVGADAGLSRDQLGRRRLIVRDTLAGYIPMNLSGWIGYVPTNSECVLYHREYLRLEGMGLVERHNLRGGRRTSHLRLTPAGRWVAEGLLAEESSVATGNTSEPLDIGDLDLSFIELPSETDKTGNDAN